MPRIYSLASNEKELVFKGHVMTAVDLLIQMNQFKAGPFLNGDHDDGAIWSMRKGVCSSFLECLRSGSRLLTQHQSTNFFQESNSFSPVCLVGAGSGIAPFR